MKLFQILFISIAQAILCLAHYTLYLTLSGYYSFFKNYDNLTFWVIAGLSFSFTIGNILIQRLPSKISSIIYHAASIWLGTLFFLFFAVSSIAIFSFFIDNNFVLNIFASGALLLAIFVSIFGVISQKYTRIREQDIYIEHLPESWQGRRAGFFADSHYGPIHNLKQAKKVVDIFNAKSVDIVFMSGDFYDGPPTDFMAVGSIFKALTPKYGKYFITGNHEEYFGIEDALRGVREGGFIVSDRITTIVEGVQIVGIPYVRTKNEDELNIVLQEANYNPDMPSIVLKHVPYELEALAKAKADLVLCGHTHKGQVWPFSYITRHMYKGFDYGLKTLEKTQVYTTSGSGSWGPPQRIGTHSELVVLTFKKK